MSSVSSARPKRQDPLSRKVPENPKFKHVRPTIDTGASITKHMEKLEEMKRDYKFKKDEIFKRMKVTTFVQLIIQVADFDAFVEQSAYNGSGDHGGDRPDTADLEVQQIQKQAGGGEQKGPDTSRSRLEEVIRGVGEADLNSGASTNSRPVINPSSCPYLLLDIREKDHYDECHIITAQSYPTAMLARSVNYESKDMLRFKNQEGKIIVLYDNDELLAHRAATTLVQRGYDNLFILSGGLKVAYKYFPEGLITGTVPASLMDTVSAGGKGKVASQPPTAREVVAADKTDFTEVDLDCLVTYIDSALGDNSSSSRLSQRTYGGAGRASVTSTGTRFSGSGRPPFKP